MKKQKKQKRQSRIYRKLKLAAPISVSNPKVIEIAQKLGLVPSTVNGILRYVGFAKRQSPKTVRKVRRYAKAMGLIAKPPISDELRKQMSAIQKAAHAAGEWSTAMRAAFGKCASEVRKAVHAAPAKSGPLLPCSCNELEAVKVRDEILCQCNKIWKMGWVESGQLIKNAI